MATVKTASDARTERDLAAITAAQRMAGAEPTEADLEAARQVLTGRMTGDEAVVRRFAEIDQHYGLTR